MRALAWIGVPFTLGLLVAACAHRSSEPDAAIPALDPTAERRTPPGTRLGSSPDIGAWASPGGEIPASDARFPWERPPEPTPPKAQIPLRLHRPLD